MPSTSRTRAFLLHCSAVGSLISIWSPQTVVDQGDFFTMIVDFELQARATPSRFEQLDTIAVLGRVTLRRYRECHAQRCCECGHFTLRGREHPYGHSTTGNGARRRWLFLAHVRWACMDCLHPLLPTVRLRNLHPTLWGYGHPDTSPLVWSRYSPAACREMLEKSKVETRFP